jgi:hypothetical protein
MRNATTVWRTLGCAALFGGLALALPDPAQAQTPVPYDGADCAASQTRPACPADLDVERVRFTSFDVTWEWERGVATPANANAKNFLVRYQEQEAGDMTLAFEADAGAKAIEEMTVRLNTDGDEDYTASITGLKPGKTYSVGVTAINTTATAMNSAEIGESGTADPARAPDDVLGLELVAGDMSIMAMWDVATDNGSEVTGYQVQHREMGKPWPTSSSRSGATADTSTMWTISNVKNGTEYEVRVRAYSYTATDDDIWSDVKSTTPSADAPTPTPAIPTAGLFLLGAGLVAASRKRLRQRFLTR